MGYFLKKAKKKDVAVEGDKQHPEKLQVIKIHSRLLLSFLLGNSFFSRQLASLGPVYPVDCGFVVAVSQ
jgi:hypothetical protein